MHKFLERYLLKWLRYKKLKLKFRKIVKTKKLTFSRFAKIGHLKIKFYWLSSIPYNIFELPVGSFGLDAVNPYFRQSPLKTITAKNHYSRCLK